MRRQRNVVSYRNSTSNHNLGHRPKLLWLLYLIEILHQTTTSSYSHWCDFRLYLIEILHQTTTNKKEDVITSPLYLIEILHQTTTRTAAALISIGCILSKFYIKPQLSTIDFEIASVVSYRNSTSNHNCFADIFRRTIVVSYRNSTSNHNLSIRCIF